MHGGWRDPEEGLHVGLGWRAAVDQRVRVDEGEVLALLLGELRRGLREDRQDDVPMIDGPGGSHHERTVPRHADVGRARAASGPGPSRQGHFRRLKRAQILLAASAGSSDEAIAKNVVVGTSTVYRTKRRFVEEGLEAALSEEPRPGAERKLAAKEEALLVATACSAPPAGERAGRWSLLADEMVRLTTHSSLSSETIRRRLAENELKPWQKKMWCIPKVDAEFVARMEDVLELYAEAPDEQHPVVCFDETPRQLIGEARVPVAPKPAGRRASTTSTCATAPRTSSCLSTCTARGATPRSPTAARAATSPSACATSSTCTTRSAERIRVVLDNLSTHSAAALYESFDAAEARRILRRLEFHFTPKHASWLNMVEIEIGVMVSQCLDRRIPTKAILVKEVKAWERRRNRDKSRIEWLFTVERAREKL